MMLFSAGNTYLVGVLGALPRHDALLGGEHVQRLEERSLRNVRRRDLRANGPARTHTRAHTLERKRAVGNHPPPDSIQGNRPGATRTGASAVRVRNP
eukprot:97964-Prorocentrum_minimum.AAC.1